VRKIAKQFGASINTVMRIKHPFEASVADRAA
jgi:hypothetical protein